MKLFRLLASLRLTLIGMIALAVGAALTYDNRLDTSAWVIVVPLAILAVNLASAIFSNPRINRKPGLLVFHLGLLGIVILAGIGRLTHLDAHVEVVQGQPFSPEGLLDVKKGPLHAGALEDVNFVQGLFTVEYAPGMQRGITNSRVLIPDARGNLAPDVVGDDRPLVLEGYRFYTTFNKGFSVLLTWIPDRGAPVTGTVNMPSYPLFEYKQDNSWTPQGGSEIKFWLQLDTGLDEEAAWVLDGRNYKGTLVVTNEDKRIELQPGESAEVTGGHLRYERLLQWMGYKVFYDPTIKWLFFVSMAAVFGLGWHYWSKMANKPLPLDRPAVSDPGTDTNGSQSPDKTETVHGEAV